MTKTKYIKIPFTNIFNIWRICYRENPSERDRLDKLDLKITKYNMALISSESDQFIQLSLSEINYLKELYESII